MFRYFQTSTLILIWALILSLLYGAWRYWRVVRLAEAGQPIDTSGGFIVPALALAPVVLVLGFRGLGVNLLFPVHFFSNLAQLAGYAFVPAVVLVVASGLGGQVRALVGAEYLHWRGKPFARVALAYGMKPSRVLQRLVLIKALARAWSRCLPWLFGELMIVEAVFNAPGLGLDAWNLARTRELVGLAEALGWLAGLYVVCLTATALVHGWIGRRLESYA